jgi:hypothetical protein
VTTISEAPLATEIVAYRGGRPAIGNSRESATAAARRANPAEYAGSVANRMNDSSLL